MHSAQILQIPAPGREQKKLDIALYFSARLPHVGVHDHQGFAEEVLLPN